MHGIYACDTTCGYEQKGLKPAKTQKETHLAR